MKTLLFALTLLTSLSSFAQTKMVMQCQAGDSIEVTFLENGPSASMRLFEGNTGEETTYQLSRGLNYLKANESDTLVGTSTKSGYLPGTISDAALLRMYQKHQNRGLTRTVGLLAVDGDVYNITDCHKN